ncbi:MAG: hypothetical protein KH384_08305 [Corynebacteriales bacterium]|nr:hypothetical protein [Mycobacteriales bacterium]
MNSFTLWAVFGLLFMAQVIELSLVKILGFREKSRKSRKSSPVPKTGEAFHTQWKITLTPVDGVGNPPEGNNH